MDSIQPLQIITITVKPIDDLKSPLYIQKSAPLVMKVVAHSQTIQIHSQAREKVEEQQSQAPFGKTIDIAASNKRMNTL